MQTFDYSSRSVWLNRARTVLEPDGSFRMVLAARDPGVANWLDTEGHRTGQLFWRFILPESEPEQPRCTVIAVADLICAARR